ncbi:MAG TPA: cytochrome c maturation protein CcmE [Terriglobales bacterium]|nr:cytochrome c maturation protein CcmE [Terriglobales bacterium]
MRPATLKFGAVIVVILATLGWLAFTGIRDSKAYFVTVTELETMPPAEARARSIRVSGDVVPGSIRKSAAETDFEISEGGRKLAVAYVGHDPLPDTFVDNAQAVAAGHLLASGSFRADGVQAKCASKYEPAAIKAARASGTAAATMPTSAAGTLR